MVIKKKFNLFILLFLFETKTHTVKLQSFIQITTAHEKSKDFLDRILPDTLLEEQQKQTYNILQKLNSTANKLIALHTEKIPSQDFSELKKLESTIKTSKNTFSYRISNNSFDSNDVNLLNACIFSLTFINTLLEIIPHPTITHNKNN